MAAGVRRTALAALVRPEERWMTAEELRRKGTVKNTKDAKKGEEDSG